MTHPHPKRNFVPTIIATKSGQVPVNVAKQSSPRAAASISTVRPVNTAAPKSKVNGALPTTYSYYKAHSPVRRAFNQKSAAKTNHFNEKVNTVWVNNVTTAAIVSAAEGNRENADQGIFDSGCSRHMTGNKSFFNDYQEINGGFVTFRGSPKVEENLHITFLENKPNVAGSGPNCLFDIVNQRKKLFAQQRAKAKRNKPMTPAQQKDYMSNYIKNQEGGYSIKGLKSLSFEQVKEIFETTIKKVQSFVPIRSELEIFDEMLKKFDRGDLVKLWDLVKERFSTTEPTDDKEKELLVELRRLFEPDNDDTLWKLQ
ncbi:hypothetical protein Tco_0924282, partial [Tanacetum coccineum]